MNTPMETVNTPQVCTEQTAPAEKRGPDRPRPRPVPTAEDLNLKPASGRLLLVGATMLVLGLVLGFLGGTAAGPHAEAIAADPKSTNPANDPDVVKLEGAQAASIKVATAALQPFHGEKTTTGRIAFNDETVTPVFSPYTGRITRLVAKPGDAVQKGDPLFEIDTPDLVQTESDLISAISSLKKSQTALNLAKRSEGIAQRNIASSTRNLELSRKNEERQKTLYEGKAVALKDWEAAQQATQQAQKDLEQGQKDYEQAQSDTKSAESDIFANETVLDAARDRLRVFGKTDSEIEKIEKARVIDRNTRVLSPISGTVTQRKVGAGQYVKPDNPDPLYVIADLSALWMLADVYESDAGLLKLGLPIEVTVMAYPQAAFKAQISYIGASVDPATHRIPVRCVVENPGQRLKSDMFATFRITTDAEIQSPAVPPGAVVQEGQKKIVWVTGPQENEFVRREVATGLEQNGFVQIVSGVKAGERIAAEGSLFLSNKANAN
ncbi:MAG: efflux RND transporter periplasmic adaptor subunit [Planctomycetota bacterium]